MPLKEELQHLLAVAPTDLPFLSAYVDLSPELENQVVVFLPAQGSPADVEGLRCRGSDAVFGVFADVEASEVGRVVCEMGEIAALPAVTFAQMLPHQPAVMIRLADAREFRLYFHEAPRDAFPHAAQVFLLLHTDSDRRYVHTISTLLAHRA